ncbi:MAG: hypothetical protein GTO15_00160, partial [Pseudomonas stutzeri]|nr:hypothetical protein [Stutzerimonas stutzeri]
MSRHRRTWTPEEAELLRQLIDIGHSYRSAAQVLERSYNSVRAKCKGLG